MCDTKTKEQCAKEHLDEVNKSIFVVERPKKLAKAGCANPSLFRDREFNIRAAKYVDGTIRFEVYDGTLQYGGEARVKESEMPISYEKFVKYGDKDGNRMLRICRSVHDDGDTDGLKIVIGKHDGNTMEFVRITHEIELDEVGAMELIRFERKWKSDLRLRQGGGHCKIHTVPGRASGIPHPAPLPKGLLAALLAASGDA